MSEVFIYAIYVVLVIILLIFGYICGNSDLKGLLEKYDDPESFFLPQKKLKDYTPPPGEGKSFKYQSKGEYLCKAALEKYFKKEFKNMRPEWLVNPATGRRLELDCYNEELKIALEYNGIQHYKYPNGISKSRDEFEKQRDRDAYKERVCKSRGIKFLKVPYTVKYGDIGGYVEKLLKDN